MMMKVLLVAAAISFTGIESYAQERKKHDADVRYMQQKHEMDARRVRETEDKRRSDSIARIRHRDSLANVRHSDSIRYSKMGRQDTIAPQDTLFKESVPPGKMYKEEMPPVYDKKEPPKKPMFGWIRSLPMWENRVNAGDRIFIAYG